MANKKFTDLLPADALPNLTGTDILAVTVDPGGTRGTPVSNKTTIANLMSLAPVQQSNIANMVETTDGIEALSNVSISNPADGSILKYVTANSQYEVSTDYATAAQGTLADSATQPGDNISTLTNDSGYITGVSAGALSDFDFDDNEILGFSAKVPTEKTADHTLTNDDNGTVVVMNSGSAIKVIVPSGLAKGFNCSVIQKGAGQVEFDNNSGASTINNRQSHTKINAQYGVASIVAYATDTYILAGDTAA